MSFIVYLMANKRVQWINKREYVIWLEQSGLSGSIIVQKLFSPDDSQWNKMTLRCNGFWVDSCFSLTAQHWGLLLYLEYSWQEGYGCGHFDPSSVSQHDVHDVWASDVIEGDEVWVWGHALGHSSDHHTHHRVRPCNNSTHRVKPVCPWNNSTHRVKPVQPFSTRHRYWTLKTMVIGEILL